jgi:YbgC/YbaW family acyl-CoA thioester hydrolase
MYKYNTIVKIHHTDAVGIAFYATYYTLAQECLETFLDSKGSSLQEILNKTVTPVVHSEADYFSPIRLSDKITIELTLDKIGTSSFALKYTFSNKNEEVVAQVKTIYVSLDKKTSKKIPIPQFLKDLFTMPRNVEPQLGKLS